MKKNVLFSLTFCLAFSICSLADDLKNENIKNLPILPEEISANKDSYSDIEPNFKKGVGARFELGWQRRVKGSAYDGVSLGIFNAIFDYHFTPVFSLGLGTGFRYDFFYSLVMVPFYLSPNLLFSVKNTNLYLSFGAGTYLDPYGNWGGGGSLLLIPSMGFRIKKITKIGV